MKAIHIGLLFLVVCCLITPIVYGEDQYNHILTLESPVPKNHAWYGGRVKIYEDKLIIQELKGKVGSYSAAGVVYIYDLEGNLLSTITSPDPDTNDAFGWRVDVYNDILIASEMHCRSENQVDYGIVNVFTIEGEHLYSFQSPEPRQGGFFGISALSINEDIIAVYENPITDPGGAGVVHLFDNQGTYLRTIYDPTPIVQGKFGSTIKLLDGVILIGDYGNEEFASTNTPGCIHFFDYNGTLLKTLESPEPEMGALFGEAISFSEGLLAIGEKRATVDGLEEAGKAYIFTVDGEHLVTLTSPNPKEGSQFGEDVVIEGDRVVVGEPVADVVPGQYEGRAYVFDVNGTLLQNLTSPEPTVRGFFGMNVDFNGEVILFGEMWAPVGNLGQAGKAQVFKLGAPVEAQEPVEETTTETEESETEAGGGIPGFPVHAILTASVIYYLSRKRIM